MSLRDHSSEAMCALAQSSAHVMRRPRDRVELVFSGRCSLWSVSSQHASFVGVVP